MGFGAGPCLRRAAARARRIEGPPQLSTLVHDRYAAAVEHAGARISLFTLQRSLLIDRIAYGNPFRAFLTGGSRPTVNPRHTLRRFEDDQRTAENMRVIRASGIPIAVVHLATRAELRRGLEFDFADLRRRNRS